MAINNLGILYAADAFAQGQRKMGRQQFGVNFLAALFKNLRTDVLPIVSSRVEDLSALAQAQKLYNPQLRFKFWPLDKFDRIKNLDSLIIADTSLSRWADLRSWHEYGNSAFSLIGITHTLSSAASLKSLMSIIGSDIQPWDALICTSSCAREAVDHVLDFQAKRLAPRFGGYLNRHLLPKRPVIPIGCDFSRFCNFAKPSSRFIARNKLHILPDQIVFLSVGRLELHAKSHPGVLLQAMSRMAIGRQSNYPDSPPPCLLVLGTAQDEMTLSCWRQAQEHFSKWFDFRLLDGNDNILTENAWSSADVFVSLADSVQETFGLTPVEAMACGLPVIASDWNGYRDTVIHGETGFLIPTRQPGKDSPQRLADLFLGRISYDSFMAELMQQVIVAEEPLVHALNTLAGDSGIRSRFGENGQRRVRENYDWPIIMSRIYLLADELAERRFRSCSTSYEIPKELSPWYQFNSWASEENSLNSNNIVSWSTANLMRRLEDQRQLDVYSIFLVKAGSDLCMPALPSVCDLLISHCNGEADLRQIAMQEILDSINFYSPGQIQQALSWLAKIGAVEIN